ncbi:hypothetical protein D3C86_1900330 [compost metagenome]
MEQLQHPLVTIDLMQRCQGAMPELAARLFEHALEVCLGDRLPHKRTDHPVGQFVIGQGRPVGDVLRFKQRQFERYEQPTVLGNARQYDLFEVDLHGRISGTHITHGWLRPFI